MWQVFTPLQSSNQNLAVLGYIVIRVHYEFRGVRTDSEQLTIPANLPLLAPLGSHATMISKVLVHCPKHLRFPTSKLLNSARIQFKYLRKKRPLSETDFGLSYIQLVVDL